MGINIEDLTIKNIKVGSSQVSRVYKGSTLVWPIVVDIDIIDGYTFSTGTVYDTRMFKIDTNHFIIAYIVGQELLIDVINVDGSYNISKTTTLTLGAPNLYAQHSTFSSDDEFAIDISKIANDIYMIIVTSTTAARIYSFTIDGSYNVTILDNVSDSSHTKKVKLLSRTDYRIPMYSASVSDGTSNAHGMTVATNGNISIASSLSLFGATDYYICNCLIPTNRHIFINENNIKEFSIGLDGTITQQNSTTYDFGFVPGVIEYLSSTKILVIGKNQTSNDIIAKIISYSTGGVVTLLDTLTIGNISEDFYFCNLTKLDTNGNYALIYSKYVNYPHVNIIGTASDNLSLTQDFTLAQYATYCEIETVDTTHILTAYTDATGKGMLRVLELN